VNLNGRWALMLLGGALVSVAAAGCRSKPVDPGEVFATRTLALAYLQRGQLPEAEAEFKKVIALVPDDRLGYANLGLTYLQSGRFREAEPALQRARELDRREEEVVLVGSPRLTRPDERIQATLAVVLMTIAWIDVLMQLRTKR